MKSGNVAALPAAVMDSESIVDMSANGFRNLEKNLRASVHTPFHIASVSKTVANVSVFKLVKSKTIDLKTDINICRSSHSSSFDTASTYISTVISRLLPLTHPSS